MVRNRAFRRDSQISVNGWIRLSCQRVWFAIAARSLCVLPLCFHSAHANAESHPRVASSSSTLLVAGVGFEPTTFRL